MKWIFCSLFIPNLAVTDEFVIHYSPEYPRLPFKNIFERALAGNPIRPYEKS